MNTILYKLFVPHQFYFVGIVKFDLLFLDHVLMDFKFIICNSRNFKDLFFISSY